MTSERNASIITAYTLLFTVALGIVAEDLWTQRNPPPVRMARQPILTERAAMASAAPSDAGVASR